MLVDGIPLSFPIDDTIVAQYEAKRDAGEALEVARAEFQKRARSNPNLKWEKTLKSADAEHIKQANPWLERSGFDILPVDKWPGAASQLYADVLQLKAQAKAVDKEWESVSEAIDSFGATLEKQEQGRAKLRELREKKDRLGNKSILAAEMLKLAVVSNPNEDTAVVVQRAADAEAAFANEII